MSKNAIFDEDLLSFYRANERDENVGGEQKIYSDSAWNRCVRIATSIFLPTHARTETFNVGSLYVYTTQ